MWYNPSKKANFTQEATRKIINRNYDILTYTNNSIT